MPAGLRRILLVPQPPKATNLAAWTVSGSQVQLEVGYFDMYDLHQQTQSPAEGRRNLDWFITDRFIMDFDTAMRFAESFAQLRAHILDSCRSRKPMTTLSKATQPYTSKEAKILPMKTVGSSPKVFAWHGMSQSFMPNLITLDKLSFEILDSQILSDDDRWTNFILSLGERQLVTGVVALTTQTLWRRLQMSTPKITQPNASPTDDMGISMSWNRGQHYLEIETLPSGTHNWFYRDRVARRSDRERDQLVNTAPAERLKGYLDLIFV